MAVKNMKAKATYTRRVPHRRRRDAAAAHLPAPDFVPVLFRCRTPLVQKRSKTGQGTWTEHIICY